MTLLGDACLDDCDQDVLEEIDEMIGECGDEQVTLEVMSTGAGTLEILMDNSEDVYGFQFNVTGVNIISAEAGDVVPGDWMLSASDDLVLGFSLMATFIPAGQGVLVNITGGTDLTLIEVDQATSIIFEEAGKDANIIFGAVIDPSLKDEIMVTVIATGFNRKAIVDDFIPKHIDSSEVKESETQILSEKENLPLYEKSNEEEEIKDNNKPIMLFDDSNPTVYGNDLEVPAFIRRQHE